ncbi:aminotransferase class V-fold PLP-dependent enzyme [Enterobacter hormaechei]
MADLNSRCWPVSVSDCLEAKHDISRTESPADFPVLTREVNGLPLAYLDSAASAQKPNQVVDAEAEFYRHGYAAVHRGDPPLSAEATQRMENVRTSRLQPSSTRVRRKSWCSCAAPPKGSTWWLTAGAMRRCTGDNIIITQMEHHANIVPWQMLCERVGAQLRVIPE